MLLANVEDFIPLAVISIPFVAVVGAIASGIVRQMSRQRLAELAQQERIAMIQRGGDPATIPMPLGDLLIGPEADRRRSQTLAISGLISIAGGAGLLVFLLLMRVDSVRPVWAVGLIPIFVGVALLVSAALVHPKDGGPPRA